MSTATKTSNLSKPQLKRGLFRNALHSNPLEMYVIENKKDLEKFLKAFPKMTEIKTMADTYRRSVAQGHIVIANDPHPITHFNTFCHESQPKENQHPSDYIRIELITD